MSYHGRSAQVRRQIQTGRDRVVCATVAGAGKDGLVLNQRLIKREAAKRNVEQSVILNFHGRGAAAISRRTGVPIEFGGSHRKGPRATTAEIATETQLRAVGGPG